jgi:probable HAF family extracellular repeat protein
MLGLVLLALLGVTTAPFRRALRWQGTTRSTLRTLGGGPDVATGISESGLVTGGSLSPADSKFHAVLWQGNTITDLGLSATHPTSGYGVDDCGTVVGDSVVDVGQDIIDAVIWQNAGPAVALESLLPAGHGWDLHTAHRINNAGQIVGYGFRSNMSGLRSFLLTPASSAHATPRWVDGTRHHCDLAGIQRGV